MVCNLPGVFLYFSGAPFTDVPTIINGLTVPIFNSRNVMALSAKIIFTTIVMGLV
jgi:hypothetical protein